MNAVVEQRTDDRSADAAIDAAIMSVCEKIAPNWPLDQSIAVNPFWHWIDRPFGEVAVQLEHLAGSRMYMPSQYYRSCWEQGHIQPHHLAQALAEMNSTLRHGAVTVEECIASLENEEPLAAQPLLSDVVDARRNLHRSPAWRDVITHQISQFCAAHFDRHQADWQPARDQGLYARWREIIKTDHGIGLLMGTSRLIPRAQALPADAHSAIKWVIAALQIAVPQVHEVLLIALLRIKGWAAWCAYVRWQARLQGRDDAQLQELLAIRLCWEWLIDDGERGSGSVWMQWQTTHAAPKKHLLCVWQRAQEIAYQTTLIPALTGNKRSAAVATPAVQAIFCIDVRSEVMRRALEQTDTEYQTCGFAGFFGLPIAYTPLGTDVQRPQLPGLLAPAMCATESCGDAAHDAVLIAQRRQKLSMAHAWKRFTRTPASAFTFVESLGLSYLKALIVRSVSSSAGARPIEHAGLMPSQSRCLHPRLLLDDSDVSQKAALAERILSAMSLTQQFARIVLLVGHGSQTSNNPQAAGLECGACGGQTGEVNARAVTALLNEPAVRQALCERGIAIPHTTWFVAGLHNTTTDDVMLFDTQRLPATHNEDIARLRIRLRQAGQRARAERAPSLGMVHLVEQPQHLERAVKARANDWAQLRPEWGLANNAAFIVAPRYMTQGLNLAGRVFLHDYNWRADADGSVLTLIMTAPMIVTHWINMQYYASTVDNDHYGSGNKILHNVVGGHIGVFEGNGGDLRIGLSMQSLHDGARWMHQPLRLSVFIAAPRDAMTNVILQHATVCHLVDNDWLYLFRIEDTASGRLIERYYQQQWSRAG